MDGGNAENAGAFFGLPTQSKRHFSAKSVVLIHLASAKK
jgi:hypothetical protein